MKPFFCFPAWLRLFSRKLAAESRSFEARCLRTTACLLVRARIERFLRRLAVYIKAIPVATPDPIKTPIRVLFILVALQLTGHNPAAEKAPIAWKVFKFCIRSSNCADPERGRNKKTARAPELVKQSGDEPFWFRKNREITYATQSFTVTVFTSVYCCKPYSPSSRPIPDCLKPPNGAAASNTS
jgi:hypothetical protein